MSLISLAGFLPKDILRHTQLTLTRNEDLHLVTRKGVFCYDYIDSVDRLEETSLPDKISFYNSMTETYSYITDEEYDFAQSV